MAISTNPSPSAATNAAPPPAARPWDADVRWIGLALGVGLLALYIPVVFFDKLWTVWQTEENSHGPIILGVLLWLFLFDKRAVLVEGIRAPRPRPVAGAVLVALGLYVYVIGRGFDALVFQLGALIPLLAGSILVLAGPKTLRALWFPLAFIVFLIPVPSSVVNELTSTLKGWVSVSAENLLYLAGFPVARSGVILQIGQYQLLVADACSGLNSMFSLSALGILYMYVAGRGSPVRRAAVLVSILPIAFAANVVRVVALVLITYYLGDAAAQGFLHSAAGIVLFLVALALLIAVDGVAARIANRFPGRRSREHAPPNTA
jgi:exosortase B